MPSNEVDAFLNEAQEDPFKKADDIIFTGEKPAEAPTVEEEEKPLPFHKDPKVQRFIEKEISRRLADVKPTETETFKKETTDDPMADVLTRIIGNDTPEKLSAIKDFKNALSGMKDEAKYEALREIEAQAEGERNEERNAMRELSEGFESIEESFDVDITSDKPSARQTRSDFVDFIKRVAPKDEEGQVSEFPDLEETWKLFQDTKKTAAPSRAKELASRSMNRSSDAASAPQQTGKSWRDVDRIFGKLLG